MKPVVRSAIRRARSRGVVGRDQLDEAEILAAADLGQRAGLLDGQVGHDRPGHARRLRRTHVVLQPVAINDRVADHRHHGDCNSGVRRTSMAKISASLIFRCQRPGVRGLDHRPVGHRVAVGDAQLAQALRRWRPATEQLGRELRGRDRRP